MTTKAIHQNREWRKYLPWGAQILVAKEFGISQQNVNRILAGKVNKPEVITSLLKIALENKLKQEAIDSEQNEILKQLLQ